MTVATYQWTLERYHQAVDAGIFGGENVELIHGELVLMVPEGPSQVFFSDRFAKLLQRLLQPTGYQQHQILRTGSISPLSFPDVAIEVERLFRQ